MCRSSVMPQESATDRAVGVRDWRRKRSALNSVLGEMGLGFLLKTGSVIWGHQSLMESRFKQREMA